MIANLDWNLLHAIQNLRCGPLDFLMPKITMLGDAGILWIAAGVILLCIRRYRKWGIALLLALAAGSLLGSGVLKPLFARERPCWLESVPMLISVPTDFSFPSGHTLASAVSAVVLTAANRKFGFFAVPAAVLIAFSRLYLFVHFPSDVLMGALIGTGIGLCASILCRRWERRGKSAEI